MQESRPDEQSIRAALEAALASAAFNRAPRLRKLLTYLVEETLAGRSANIKAFTIAVDVFERDQSFDPNTDPLVRVQAGRVRAALENYYTGVGRSDAVRIEVPTGGYVPVFRRAQLSREIEKNAREKMTPETDGDASAPADQPAAAAAVPLATNHAAAPDPIAGVASGEPRVQLDDRSFVTRVAKTAWPALTQRPSPIVLATLAIVAVALFVLARAWRDTNAAIDAAHPPVLAVSTFKLLGPSQEFEFLAEGLRFDLQFELARFSWLAVSADHSDAAAQRPGKQPGSRKRNADYQLEGTINVSGQAVALSYQLISLKDSLVKWSKRSNVELSGNELVQLQRSAAEAIAIEIGHPSGVIKLLEQNRYRAQTKDVNGYLCLLRTYDYWNRFDKKSHGNVRNCLEQAIAKDSTDAQAHAALSFVYLDEFRYKQNIRPESDPLKRSLATAERAAELDPFSALAKQALFTSHHFNGDGPAFRKYGLQAVELSPNNPEVLADFGGKLALYYGEWDRGMTFVQRAMELNPNPPAWFHITDACSAIMQNDPKRALEVSEQMRTSSWSLYHVIRAIAAAGLEDRNLAKIEWDRLATFGVNSIDDIRTTIANLRYHAALEKVLVERLTSSFKLVHGKP